MKLKPAEYVVHIFGGVRASARKLKISPSTVSRWRTTGGEVPTRARKKILKYAMKNGMDITPSHLEWGYEFPKSK